MKAFGLMIILIRTLTKQNHSEEVIEKILPNLRRESDLEHMLKLCMENQNLTDEELIAEAMRFRYEL